MSLNQNNLVGIDKIGRKVEAVTKEDNGKKVGCFFWLWMGQPFSNGTWDSTEILKNENGAEILYHKDVPGVSPAGQAHWWGKPLWGYYNSDDEWVLRKQIEMLASAGVDFIAFDTTNEVTYPQVYQRVMKVVEEMVLEGHNPPRCAFYTHTHSMATTRVLYRDLYSKGLYEKAWYRVNGKPFIIAFTDPEADKTAEAITIGRFTDYHTDPFSQEILDFFSFRRPQWPTNNTVYPDGFPWIEWIYPQPLHTDMMNVTVGSHPNVPMSFTRTRGVENWGRGWDPVNKVNVPENCEEGSFFQLQWDHVIAERDKLDTVFVGGWNEWIAYKQMHDGEYMLCDAADMELSRDIEPMEGGYEDNFYLQLIRNVRRFKAGNQELVQTGGQITCDIQNPESFQAADTYEKIGRQPAKRDTYGCTQQLRYTADPARNTLNTVHVANDTAKLYFRVDAHSDFLPFTAADNTCLYIGTGQPEQKGYYSYEYVLKRTNNDIMTLYALNTDGAAQKITDLPCVVCKNALMLSLDLALLNKCDRIYFKATDSVVLDDIMKTYTTGSAMPMGRLSYEYILK